DPVPAADTPCDGRSDLTGLVRVDQDRDRAAHRGKHGLPRRVQDAPRLARPRLRTPRRLAGERQGGVGAGRTGLRVCLGLAEEFVDLANPALAFTGLFLAGPIAGRGRAD